MSYLALKKKKNLNGGWSADVLVRILRNCQYVVVFSINFYWLLLFSVASRVHFIQNEEERKKEGALSTQK